eukprot:SAG22_NODE_7464_length_736_cov_29.566719_1_plen_52_part_10
MSIWPCGGDCGLENKNENQIRCMSKPSDRSFDLGGRAAEIDRRRGTIDSTCG